MGSCTLGGSRRPKLDHSHDYMSTHLVQCNSPYCMVENKPVYRIFRCCLAGILYCKHIYYPSIRHFHILHVWVDLRIFMLLLLRANYVPILFSLSKSHLPVGHVGTQKPAKFFTWSGQQIHSIEKYVHKIKKAIDLHLFHCSGILEY